MYLMEKLESLLTPLGKDGASGNQALKILVEKETNYADFLLAVSCTLTPPRVSRNILLSVELVRMTKSR